MSRVSRNKSSDAAHPHQRGSSLSSKVRQGAFWSIATTILLRLAGLLITAVVARILDPRAFGVFAVAVTVYVIVTAVGELGIAPCLVRADLEIDALGPTMVTVSLATSMMLAGAMVAFAQPIATALGSPAAAGPVKVMALVLAIQGLSVVPTAQLTREFRQKKLFDAQAISFIFSNAVLILLAKYGSGAMAFAWSRVAGQSVVTLIVFASVPKNYRPSIRRGALSVLATFGVPLGAAHIVEYVLLNVDYALIGHFLGATSLGIYVLAFNVASWPTTLLATTMVNVGMPAFSHVKHDARLLAESIASGIRAVSLVVMPMSALTIALARPLVLTLYGAKWTESATVVSVLSLYGAVSILCVLFANIIAALGRSKLLLLIQATWLGALVPVMILGARSHGVVGAAVAHVVVILPLVLPLYLLALRRVAKIHILSLGRAAIPAILAASVAAAAAKGAASQFSSPLAQMTVGLAAGTISYVIIMAPQAIALFNRGNPISQRGKTVLLPYSLAGRWARTSLNFAVAYLGRRPAGGLDGSRRAGGE